MSNLYNVLLAVHIFSSIIAIGPLFTINTFYKSTSKIKEIKYAHIVTTKISRVIDAGFGLQFITGLLMGLINPKLFQMLWYNLSIVLFILTVVYFNTVVKSRTKSLENKINTYNDTMLPKEYNRLVKDVNVYERFGKLLVIVIIILMIFKP